MAISGCASRGMEGALSLFLLSLPRGWSEREGGGWATFPAPGWEGSAAADQRPQEPATAVARPCYSVCAHVLTRSPLKNLSNSRFRVGQEKPASISAQSRSKSTVASQHQHFHLSPAQAVTIRREDGKASRSSPTDELLVYMQR